MFDPENGKLIAYYCDESGEPCDDGSIDLDNIPGWLVEEFGLYDFYCDEYILEPDNWPEEYYPNCGMCGENVLGDAHYVLQWGDCRELSSDEDWAVWQLAIHPECLVEFFEQITGGVAFFDEEDYLQYRDDAAYAY